MVSCVFRLCDVGMIAISFATRNHIDAYTHTHIHFGPNKTHSLILNCNPYVNYRIRCKIPRPNTKYVCSICVLYIQTCSRAYNNIDRNK